MEWQGNNGRRAVEYGSFKAIVAKRDRCRRSSSVAMRGIVIVEQKPVQDK